MIEPTCDGNVIPFSLPGFQIDEVTEVRGKLIIEAHTVEHIADCPDCATPSRHVHSHYTRSPRDLPCGGQMVQLELHVRRFKCLNAMCPRKTFAERIPEVVPVHAQRTSRLTATLRGVGFELSGEAGTRIARCFEIKTSGDTILRIIRDTDLDLPKTVKVLGIDDWAFKKGHNYGTIVVDLENHRPVDLLPDREAETVAAWLEAHPGIEIITRDRAKAYIDGATVGAPNAVQIADRWHLLKNLSDAIYRMFQQHAKALRMAAKRMQERTAEDAPTVMEVTEDALTVTADVGEPDVIASPAVENPPSHRQLLFDEVKRLAEEGYGQRAIARQLHMDRKTVRRYLQADELPCYYRVPRPTKVAPYMPYLQSRLAEGGQNRLQLYREIQAQGFTGCYATLRSALTSYPRERKQSDRRLLEIPIPRPLSARQATWLLVKPTDELDPEETLYCEVLRECCSDADASYPLAQRFVGMFKQREADKLDPWLKDAQSNPVAQLRRFAKGLKQDYDAVRAALVHEWSNGQVEGQVNRLKFIKRQMYGRAKFDLLRLRVLYYDDS